MLALSACTPSFEEPVFVTSLVKSKQNRKRYECNLCSKYFSRPSALQTHIYTHTGEKPHECDIPGCGRRFAVVSNLRRHLRVHKPNYVRRRLSSQERRKFVENLIQKSSISLEETYIHNNELPFISYSNDASPVSSPSLSPQLLPSTLESSYRLLRPKETKSKPLCLTVKHLLN